MPQTSTDTEWNQDSLNQQMRDQIRGQTWQFQTGTFIRMLSPRNTKNLGENTRRSDFTFEVDEKYFKLACTQALKQFRNLYSENLQRTDPQNFTSLAWPVDSETRGHYAPFARLLNDCIQISHSVLDIYPKAPQLTNRYHKNLIFVTYDRETGDKIEGEAPLKPGIFGGTNTDVAGFLGNTPEKAWWSPEDGTDRNKISYPCEVKHNWPEIVERAATYARCLFNASPTTTFALVLGYNHVALEVRFLIFHRSGLTSSESLRITTMEGQWNLIQIILTLLLWITPAHAGFMPSCNGAEWILPSSKDDMLGARWLIDIPLYRSVCVRSRATHVFRVCRPQDNITVFDPPSSPTSDVILDLRCQTQTQLDTSHRSTYPCTQTAKKPLSQPSWTELAKANDKGKLLLLAL